MKNLVHIIFTILFCTINLRAQRNIPPLMEERKKNIDIKHLVINLQFDWQKRQAYGTTSVVFSTLKPSAKITLDAGILTVNNVKMLNGIDLQFRYDGGDKNDGLEIVLDRIYEPNEEVKIIIDYHTNWVNESDPNNIWGSVGKGLRFFQPTFTEPKKRTQIWSAGEPEGNRYWFPCYDGLGDIRTTELIATVDEKLNVISNGKILNANKNGKGQRTFHWATDLPYPNYQTFLVIGEYLDVQLDLQTATLHSYGYPDEVDAVAASVERLPDMVNYFSKVTATGYPFKYYSQVFVQDFPSWTGSGNASTITENMIDDKRTHADYFYLWDLTEAEALAHQWFGTYVTCDDWSEVWLNKSFAHYFNELYNKQKNGNDEFLLYQTSYDLSMYLGDWHAGYKHPIVSKNYDAVDGFMNDNYAVFRGALVLRMLHKHLGDEKWWKIIRLYLKSNAHKTVTTKDFLKVVEEVNGEKMNWFFDQWIYKMGHPVFEIEKNYNKNLKELILTVKQIQQPDTASGYPQVDYFKGSLEIEIDNRIEKVWLDAKAENVFKFKSIQEPKLINFDYESVWIKEVVFQKTINELIYQAKYDKDISAKQSALNELTSAYEKETNPETRAKIVNCFRNVILSNSYWRLRFNTLSQLRNLLTKPNEAAKLDVATLEMLMTLIKNEKAWLKASAITFLGMTKDAKYSAIYIAMFKDESERVVNAAAIALGKCKSAKAYDALVKLKDKPSWKNQSLISALNGLKELGDLRGTEVAMKALADKNSAHWTLATPVWDYRLAAAETLVSLGKGSLVYEMLLERFKRSMEESDVNDIFSNVLLISKLCDARSSEILEPLKIKFKDDANARAAIAQYETQLKAGIKQNQNEKR